MKVKINKSLIYLIIAYIFAPSFLFIFIYENWERKKYFPGKTYAQHLKDKYLPSLRNILIFIIMLVIINFYISSGDYSSCKNLAELQEKKARERGKTCEQLREEIRKVAPPWSSPLPCPSECTFPLNGFLSYFNLLNKFFVDWFAGLLFFYSLTPIYISSAIIAYIIKYRKLYLKHLRV